MTLCNVTGVATFPDGTVARNVAFTLHTSDQGVVKNDGSGVVQANVRFDTGPNGEVNFTAQSGEYTLSCEIANDVVIYVPEQSSANFIDIVPIAVFQRNSVVRLRQGDTLALGCVYVNHYEVPLSLEGIAVTAAMKGRLDTVYEVTPAITDSGKGEFTLTMPASDTGSIPVGKYDLQVTFESEGFVQSSMNIDIHVIRGF